MIICQICQEKIENFQKLSSHIKKHKISSQEYYEKYYVKGKCEICGYNEVKFLGLNKGFRKFCKKCCYGLTLEKCIIRHGKEKGEKIWKDYCKKQSISNTFEYKNKKYGMTIEDFNNYNKSRAVTLENLIKRHGKEKGEKIWKDYCHKQSINGSSLNYFIEKFGEKQGNIIWQNINKNKVNSLENFKKRYGQQEGILKFEEYMSNKKMKSYSKISQELFWNIYENLTFKENIYFYELNKEFGKLNIKNGEYYYYDFVDLSNKKIIEFNGNVFHVKNIKESKDWKNPFSNISAKECYIKDKRKEKFIKNLGFKILYIWEDDYKLNKQKILLKCLNFLGD